MDSNKTDIKLSETILSLIEGTITKQQLDLLEKNINTDEDFAKKYIDFMLNHAAIIQRKEKIEFSPASYDMNIWSALLQCEKKAQTIEFEKTIEQPQEVIPAKKAPPAPKIVKKANHRLLAAAAAILSCIFIITALAMLVITPRENVAYLSDSMNAKWTENTELMETGKIFTNKDKPFTLKSGFVKIQYLYGSEIIVEGPASFTCTSSEELFLEHGKAYAKVPPKATGFTINTPNAKIIDIGTEFGVDVAQNGNSSVHMYKGKASLLSGEPGDIRSSEIITQQQARMVNSQTQKIKNIQFSKLKFVRKLNSKNNLIWKGEEIDLADFTGKGNGFGTAFNSIGINPNTGEFDNGEASRKLNNIGNQKYNPVKDSYAIDGIFVPNDNNTIVSSQGHVFDQCPKTSNRFDGNLKYCGYSGKDNSKENALVFNNKNYTNELPYVLMHANLGITFDLNKIRGKFPDLKIKSFNSKCGITDAVIRNCNADVYVLIDGKIKYQNKNIHDHGILFDIQFEISDQDQFLTLVATDGNDPETGIWPSYAIDQDWCSFISPILELE